MSHKVSVVIPVLNGEKSIRNCLESILKQDVAIHECIVVDNNSSDHTKDIVKKLQSVNNNIKYVFEPMVSRGAARFKGVAEATGDIIVMTDVDCVVPSDWVRRLTQPIVSGHELVTVGGQFDIGKTYWSRHMQKLCDYVLATTVDRNGYCTFTDTKNFAVAAGLIKRVQFDRNFKSLEDVELEMRLRYEARFRYLPEVKVGHRHAQSFFAVMKVSCVRAYWRGQIYHKFKGIRDKNGFFIFVPVSSFKFYRSLLHINFKALRKQGLSHTLFFFTFDIPWKIGSAVGHVRPIEALRRDN